MSHHRTPGRQHARTTPGNGGTQHTSSLIRRTAQLLGALDQIHQLQQSGQLAVAGLGHAENVLDLPQTVAHGVRVLK